MRGDSNTYRFKVHESPNIGKSMLAARCTDTLAAMTDRQA